MLYRVKVKRSNPAKMHTLKYRIQNGCALRNQVKAALNREPSAPGGLAGHSRVHRVLCLSHPAWTAPKASTPRHPQSNC